jgi:hypothetical protein
MECDKFSAEKQRNISFPNSVKVLTPTYNVDVASSQVIFGTFTSEISRRIILYGCILSLSRILFELFAGNAADDYFVVRSVPLGVNAH